LALYFASGESLYAGAALFLLRLGLSRWLRGRWQARLGSLMTWAALGLMVMACPPFPAWLYGIFAVAVLVWLAREPLARRLVPRRAATARAAATLVLAALVILLSALEFPYRRLPHVPRAERLTVIGDSLSAGVDPRDPPWPAVFGRKTGLAVNNLSKPGAQMADAVDFAQKLTPDDRLVLIEMGGNDLIANVPTPDFAAALDRLLAAVTRAPGRRVVMFELPLLPHKIGYGRVQRALAARYGVVLIPKRALIRVLAGDAATSDGLHLSAGGAERMAELVASVLR
jgi:acyl-CoA thioesterase-1